MWFLKIMRGIASPVSISGIIVLALVVSLGVSTARAYYLKGQVRLAKSELAIEQMAHGISKKSADDLAATLSKFVEDGEVRKVAQVAALEAAAKENASLRSQAKDLRAEAETIKEAAGADCRTPRSVMRARGL